MGISKTNFLAIPFLLHCLMILAYLIFKSIESNYDSTFFIRRVSPTFSVGGPCGMKEN